MFFPTPFNTIKLPQVFVQSDAFQAGRMLHCPDIMYLYHTGDKLVTPDFDEYIFLAGRNKRFFQARIEDKSWPLQTNFWTFLKLRVPNVRSITVMESRDNHTRMVIPGTDRTSPLNQVDADPIFASAQFFGSRNM
jgi:hypothetical protein